MTMNAHETENRTKPTRHRWVKWFFLVYFGAVAVVVLWFTVISGPVPLEISEKTTIFTEPLTPDEKGVDYHEAVGNLLAPPEMKTDENGYRMIVQRFGPCRIVPVSADPTRTELEEKQQRYEKQVYEKLGLDPTVKPDLQLMDFDTHLYEYANDHFADKAEREAFQDDYRAKLYRKPEPSDPVVQAWLQQNDESLDVIVEALNRSVYYSPLVSLDETDPVFTGEAIVNEFLMNLLFHRSLMKRFQVRVASGDLDGAMDDAIACQRLARFMGNSGIMSDVPNAKVFDEIGSSLNIAVYAEHQVAAEQIRRYLRKIDALPPVPSFCEILKREHYYSLDLLQKIAQGKTTFKSSKRGFSFMPQISLDWNSVFQCYNEFYRNETDIYCRDEGLDISYVMLNNGFSREARSQRLAFDFRGDILSRLHSTEELLRNWEIQAQTQRETLETLLHERENAEDKSDD